MGSSASDAFHELDPASSGGSGRKLHADAGRFATRLKIWLSSRCCSVISCACARARASAPSGRVARGGAYYLGVEFYEARLAVVVEDEDGVDHGGGGVGKACGGGRQLARVSCEVEMGQGWGCIM